MNLIVKITTFIIYMMCLFLYVPSDIVEIVIAYTRHYNTFKSIQTFCEKLQNNIREKRIIDKITRKCKHLEYKDAGYVLYFTMDNKYHREYDKPGHITHGCMSWVSDDRDNRYKDLPTTIDVRSYRKWENRCSFLPIDLKNQDLRFRLKDGSFLIITTEGLRYFSNYSQLLSKFNILL